MCFYCSRNGFTVLMVVSSVFEGQMVTTAQERSKVAGKQEELRANNIELN